MSKNILGIVDTPIRSLLNDLLKQGKSTKEILAFIDAANLFLDEVAKLNLPMEIPANVSFLGNEKSRKIIIEEIVKSTKNNDLYKKISNLYFTSKDLKFSIEKEKYALKILKNNIELLGNLDKDTDHLCLFVFDKIKPNNIFAEKFFRRIKGNKLPKISSILSDKYNNALRALYEASSITEILKFLIEYSLFKNILIINGNNKIAYGVGKDLKKLLGKYSNSYEKLFYEVLNQIDGLIDDIYKRNSSNINIYQDNNIDNIITKAQIVLQNIIKPLLLEIELLIQAIRKHDNDKNEARLITLLHNNFNSISKDIEHNFINKIIEEVAFKLNINADDNKYIDKNIGLKLKNLIINNINSSNLKTVINLGNRFHLKLIAQSLVSQTSKACNDAILVKNNRISSDSYPIIINNTIELKELDSKIRGAVNEAVTMLANIYYDILVKLKLNKTSDKDLKDNLINIIAFRKSKNYIFLSKKNIKTQELEKITKNILENIGSDKIRKNLLNQLAQLEKENSLAIISSQFKERLVDEIILAILNKLSIHSQEIISLEGKICTEKLIVLRNLIKNSLKDSDIRLVSENLDKIAEILSKGENQIIKRGDHKFAFTIAKEFYDEKEKIHHININKLGAVINLVMQEFKKTSKNSLAKINTASQYLFAFNDFLISGDELCEKRKLEIVEKSLKKYEYEGYSFTSKGNFNLLVENYNKSFSRQEFIHTILQNQKTAAIVDLIRSSGTELESQISKMIELTLVQYFKVGFNEIRSEKIKFLKEAIKQLIIANKVDKTNYPEILLEIKDVLQKDIIKLKPQNNKAIIIDILSDKLKAPENINRLNKIMLKALNKFNKEKDMESNYLSKALVVNPNPEIKYRIDALKNNREKLYEAKYGNNLAVKAEIIDLCSYNLLDVYIRRDLFALTKVKQSFMRRMDEFVHKSLTIYPNLLTEMLEYDFQQNIISDILKYKDDSFISLKPYLSIVSIVRKRKDLKSLKDNNLKLTSSYKDKLKSLETRLTIELNAQEESEGALRYEDILEKLLLQRKGLLSKADESLLAQYIINAYEHLRMINFSYINNQVKSKNHNCNQAKTIPSIINQLNTSILGISSGEIA